MVGFEIRMKLNYFDFSYTHNEYQKFFHGCKKNSSRINHFSHFQTDKNTIFRSDCSLHYREMSNSALSLLFSISLVSMAVDVIERSSSLDIQMTVYGLYLKRHLLKL